MEAGALRAPAGLNRITVTAPLLRLRSDEQLVALFRAGNDTAFGVIHDRYRQRLFAYARQMLGGSRQDAEDALQDVFLRAYSSLRSNDRPLSLRAWLYRVAHNRCIDHLRKPIPPAIDLFETSRKPLHDPIAESERREDLRQLIVDVRRLPDQQRSALLMREIDGLSYAELAEALGVTLQAVKSLLVRARIGLVEAIEARDTACDEIRLDLAAAFDRGVRASGRTRKHLRDCKGCTEYRAALRGVNKKLAALMPSPGLLAGGLKLVGLSGAGSAGAATAGGGAAGGGALVAASSGTIAKVAVVVCAAAITAGGAAEVQHQMAAKPQGGASHARSSTASRAQPATPYRRDAVIPASAVTPAAAAAAAARKRTIAAGSTHKQPNSGSTFAPPSDFQAADAPISVDATTGGASAPDEETGFGYGADGLTPTTGSDPGTSGAVATTGAAETSTGSPSSPPSAGDKPTSTRPK
ncbi:MAG: hypothetical protein QOG15_1568 [Solirubrobacteraceae bacterium]|jgi:RNA polymerase sigma factor (sigma-70 family)|nr:hypothetical protein [Solirubrobacteraceae bacterium]